MLTIILVIWFSVDKRNLMTDITMTWTFGSFWFFQFFTGHIYCKIHDPYLYFCFVLVQPAVQWNMEQIAHQLPAHHPLMQNLNHQNNHQTSHQSHPNGMVQPASPTDSMEDISKTNLIINYLPQEMNQEEIKELFGKFGEIESCKLVKDKLTGIYDTYQSYYLPKLTFRWKQSL